MSELCFSTDGEIFNATEKDEILGNLFSDRLLVVGATYYSADLVRPRSSSFFDVETILDAAQQAAYELCDEWAEDFLCDVGEDAKNELSRLISGWAEKHAPDVHFWLAQNITEHTIDQEEIDGFFSRSAAK